MTNKLLAFAVVLPLCTAATITALPAWAQTAGAQNAGAQTSTTAPAAAPLPVRAVTLFSSGVSYTLREGEVTGNATVPLLFRTTQINDILKSLTLLDETGRVQPAIYAAKDPIGRTLQSFAVDVSRPPSLADLLNQLRGAKVVVEAGGTVIAAATTTQKRTLEGQIVGVESSEESGGIAYLSVLGEAGLQTVRLSEVNSVRLLDERLNREFREALGLLAAGSDDKRRQVTLRFDGNGKRRVRVGYVSEAPLWKISYRLLIGGASATAASAPEAPYLQGWALVENTTDEDWTNVRLALVSGRPVSFIQDLYQPLYLPRPVVPPDVVASPYPQVAEGAIEGDDLPRSVSAPASPLPSVSAARGGRKTENRAMAGGAGGFGGGAMADMANGSVTGVAAMEAPGDSMYFKRDAGVTAQASGEKTGELFQYNISTPVTLPRQQAAMIPVIAQNIAGDKVSLYNADTNARFPLNAFRIVNNTKLHLKGGPVTIFDKNVYAGDARMEDVPPGDSRLVTYAVDLAVEGERQNNNYSTVVETTLVIRRGVLYTSRRNRQTTDYSLKNKASDPRTILVEHPFNAAYKLIAPEKSESRTPSFYRFAVVVAPGATEKLKVVTEQSATETVALLNYNLEVLAAYVQRGDVPEKIKAALREVVTRRKRVQDLQSQAASADAEIASIDKDQDRIRKNMAALDKASALYKRYVTQLDGQENRIQALRGEATRLRALAAQADRDLRAYLDSLDLTP